MLGLGETTRGAARRAGRPAARSSCDMLTLGQYLTPTLKHIPVARYLPPEEFDELAVLARSLGLPAGGERAVRAFQLSRRRDGGPCARPSLLPELRAGARCAEPVVRRSPATRSYEGDRLVEVLVGGATFDVAAPATGCWSSDRPGPTTCCGGAGARRAGDERQRLISASQSAWILLRTKRMQRFAIDPRPPGPKLQKYMDVRASLAFALILAFIETVPISPIRRPPWSSRRSPIQSPISAIPVSSNGTAARSHRRKPVDGPHPQEGRRGELG